MKKILVSILILPVFVLWSCGSREINNRMVEASLADTQVNQPSPPEKVASDDRKIIREGDITFESADIKETRSVILNVTKELNGYISKESSYDYPDRTEQSLIIRVPADKFEILLARISETAKKIDSKNINTLDVTEEYIDAEARLKTKKELEERYRELLKQANKVEEVLSVEREIGTLRGEIESVEGRLRYLKDKVAFSTLTVTCYQKGKTGFGFSSKIGGALKSGWKGLLWFLIGLTAIWPFIILIGIGLCTAVIITRRRRAKKHSP